MEELKAKINDFLVYLNGESAKYWAEMGYTHNTPPTYEAVYSSEKWAKIVRVEMRGDKPTQTAVEHFVCLQDGQTKMLGYLKQGDIFKSASATQPAKHARGSVYNSIFLYKGK